LVISSDPSGQCDETYLAATTAAWCADLAAACAVANSASASTTTLLKHLYPLAATTVSQ